MFRVVAQWLTCWLSEKLPNLLSESPQVSTWILFQKHLLRSNSQICP